jgi:hypothetical protein
MVHVKCQRQLLNFYFYFYLFIYFLKFYVIINNRDTLLVTNEGEDAKNNNNFFFLPLDNNSTQHPKRELDRESRKKEKKNDAYLKHTKKKFLLSMVISLFPMTEA